MTTVLVTGATGFVGRSLCRALARSGHRVRAAVRNAADPDAQTQNILVGEINGSTDWRQALDGVDIVVHLAARAHLVTRNESVQQRDAYFAVNAQGTQRLAQACVSSGVRLLLYMSTVKVNGEQTFAKPFGPYDAAAPCDTYGESKWMGEQVVQSLDRNKLDWVIVRAPLVYGPGVRANFLRLIRWVERGWPLPFGSLLNRRSLIYVENLSNLIVCAIETEKAVGRVLMASDRENLSTPELCRQIAAAMGRKAHLWRVSPRLLKKVGSLMGLTAEVSRLTESLVVDSSSTAMHLGWTPPFSTDEGIMETVAWYMRLLKARGGDLT